MPSTDDPPTALRCPQCGQPYAGISACGPTHAILAAQVASAPDLVRLVLAARADAALAAARIRAVGVLRCWPDGVTGHRMMYADEVYAALEAEPPPVMDFQPGPDAVWHVPDAVTSLERHLALISAKVTASYPPDVQAVPELVLRRRVTKVANEVGEMLEALEGYTGENPRKGVYATREDVVKELLDCASAALCAVEHMTGNYGIALHMLAEQVAGNVQRLVAALEAAGVPG